MLKLFKNKPLLIIILLALLGAIWWLSTTLSDDGLGDDFISGNGRIEATEIDIAAKLPGRVQEVLVREGDFVTAGQVLATMQIDTLNAQLDEAKALQQHAQHAVTAAEAQVTLRENDIVVAQALVTQREAELDAARSRLKRSEALAAQGAVPQQELDDDRVRVRSSEATLAASRAQVLAAEAAVAAAKAQVIGSQSQSQAAQATIARIQADITDSELRAPIAGRIQFRVAQPGEVLGSGGRVLNLLDVSDVYMTFFVPETVAGRIALGSEARIIVDAAPDTVIPAKVSFIASQAQFTPKTVETASERQKLMFRVRAQIAPELLERYLEHVKTGVPGVAWIKLNPDADWPAVLSTGLLD